MNTNKIPFENESMFTALGCAEENEKQNNPLNLPEGFYHSKTSDGRDLGLGYYCPKCKLNFPANSPA